MNMMKVLSFTAVLHRGDADRKLLQTDPGGDRANKPLTGGFTWSSIKFHDFHMNIMIEGYFKEDAAATIVQSSEITSPLEAFLTHNDSHPSPNEAYLSDIVDESEKILVPFNLYVADLNVEDIFRDENQSCVRGTFSKVVVFKVQFNGVELKASEVMDYYETKTFKEYGALIKADLMKQEMISENLVLIKAEFYMAPMRHPDHHAKKNVSVCMISFIVLMVL